MIFEDFKEETTSCLNELFLSYKDTTDFSLTSYNRGNETRFNVFISCSFHKRAF